MNAQFASPGEALTRSAKSRAFEAMWRSLRDESLVPDRGAFKPARAARFLSEMVLLEVPREADTRLMVRLVGTAVDARLQTNIAQQDYIQYLPEAHRADAWRSCRMMTNCPCGLWQVSNLRYERGISNLVEMTLFPLHGEGVDYIICLMNFIGMGATQSTLPRAISADTALVFEFLDVGNGAPVWTSATRA